MRIMRCCVIVVSIVAAGGGPPAKPQQDPEEYFPTELGAKWVYTNGEAEFTEVITGVEDEKGKKVVSVGQEDGSKIRPMMKIAVSKDGLYKVASFQREIKPPQCLLKLPFEKGAEWETTDIRLSQDGKKVKFEALGKEDVEVPAGKYVAIKVKSYRTTTWYAPKVGPVKVVVEGDGYERVQTLKKFEPGKGMTK